jgi:FtsH-binding integral membrane protein
MNNINFSQQSNFSTGVNVNSFMANVFAWMFLALALTAGAAYYFASDAALMSTLVTTTGLSGLGYVVMFAPFIFGFAMSAGFNRFSYNVLVILYVSYALIMGISFSFILLAYTGASIFKTFAICSAMYGIMAVVGYTTKADLSKMGSILMMALFGLLIASVVNYFMHSDTMSYIISFIGVVIFTGLTAYDVQKLKEIAMGNAYPGETMKKLVIMGALNLYLDFINLFLFLLRFFGDRRND